MIHQNLSDTFLAFSVEIAPAHSAQRQLLRHIKPKKRHELQRLCSVIACVAAGSTEPLSEPPLDPAPASNGEEEQATVVDIGCGQGYLARMLAYVHGLDVVGVEAAQSNTDTAAEKATSVPAPQPPSQCDSYGRSSDTPVVLLGGCSTRYQRKLLAAEAAAASNRKIPRFLQQRQAQPDPIGPIDPRPRRWRAGRGREG